MGTARSWRDIQTAWREGTAGRNPGRDYGRDYGDGWQGPRHLDELEEFDWDSLRRAFAGEEGESHQERAERSVALVNATIAADRRQKRWLQLAAVLLAPLVLVLTYRLARETFA